jgi:hypothetical protein
MNFNIETTAMVTSLFLCLHHSMTALILNFGTVGTEVLTSRPDQFTPGKEPGTFSVRYWVDARTGLQALE